MTKIKVGAYNVTITNPDRILFPKSKITKEEFIAYYLHIASHMLGYLKDRPISMQRFPEGIDHEGFYQKDAADYFPAWIKRKKIAKTDGTVDYVVVNNAATLVYLANLACITIHPWLSRIDKLNYPDRIVFDLDPSGKNFDFNLVRTTALRLKDLLKELGLESYVMTTGSRGLHIWIPIKRLYNYEFVKKFSHDIARVLLSYDAKNLTLEMRKNKRGKKIFIDWLRNSQGATSVAPYSVRPKEGAPIAMPVPWTEIEDKKLTAQRYTIYNVFDALKKRTDPWKDMEKQAHSLSKARLQLDMLLTDL
ncbi:MAG: non-homologous end-joining DNA ligase [Candidatus Dependentiae bacterium]